MNVERFFQVLIELTEKGFLDEIMRDGGGWVSIVRVVWCVLHEAIHDVVAFGAESPIEDAGDGEVHKRSQADSVFFGLIVGLCKQIHGVTIDVNGPSQQFFRIHP